MSDLGQLLKKARTQRNLSLEELEEITKIRRRYLEAIEEGDYGVLPGSFYVRAFIKSYAEAVALDPQEVLEMYKTELPAPPEPVVEPIRRKRPRSGAMVRWSRYASGFFMVAFLLLIVGLIYYYFVYNEQGQSPEAGNAPITDKQVADAGGDLNADKPADADAGTGGADQTAPDQTSAPPAKDQQETTQPPKPEIVYTSTDDNGWDHYEAKNAEKLDIAITASGDCWLEILSGNQYVANNLTLHKGDSKTWSVNGSAHIHIGNARAVQITVNGVSLNTGDTSSPKHFLIDPAPKSE